MNTVNILDDKYLIAFHYLKFFALLTFFGQIQLQITWIDMHFFFFLVLFFLTYLIRNKNCKFFSEKFCLTFLTIIDHHISVLLRHIHLFCSILLTKSHWFLKFFVLQLATPIMCFDVTWGITCNNHL